MAKIDVTGRRVGTLTVIGEGPKQGAAARWYCRCDCGSVTLVRGSVINRGAVKGCGSCSKFKHGKPPEWSVWRGMRYRCNNPDAAGYSKYGGRGIRVCDEWDRDFLAFWRDMGPRPSPAHSLDRINNDGHYEPCNCRWATSSEQGNNRRTNHIVTYNGVKMTIAQCAKAAGLPYEALRHRISTLREPANVAVERAMEYAA